MQAARRRLARQVILATLLVSLAASCGGDGEPGTPAASEPAPVTQPKRTTTTEAMTSEEEVEAAYLRSWEVYAEAVRTLDPSGLEESYANEQLARTRAEVEERARLGEPSSVDVDHDYDIQILEEGFAVVRDTYRNHSVLIDPETGEPVEEDPNSEITEVYTLWEVDGRWVVVDIVRES